MKIVDLSASLSSVMELIQTVTDLQGQKVCYLIADRLRRALEDNARLTLELADCRTELGQIKEQLAWFKRQIFGDKGEGLPSPLVDSQPPAVPPDGTTPLSPGQRSGHHQLAEAESTAQDSTPPDEAKIAEAKALRKKARALMRESHAPSKKRGTVPSQGRVLSEVVRCRVPSDIVCVLCKDQVRDLGLAHTATELDIIPATFIKRTYLLHRGECGCGAIKFVMPGPDRGLTKTNASSRLITECAVDKFQYHFPIHRQVAWFKDHGLNISKSTLNGWILRGAETLKPLWRAICASNRKEPVKQCDESPVCVVKDGQSKDHHLWCVLTENAVSFEITEDRNQDVAKKVLGETGEATMTDGHGAYSKRSVPGTHANCMAHSRRKFFDALLSFPKESFAFLIVIHGLFMVEREADAKNLDAAGRLNLRKRKSIVLVNELATLLGAYNPPPKSTLGKAIKYTKKRWEKLTVFLRDGRIPLSNNAVESRFRDAKLGFKNFLFSQCDLGTEAVVIFYTLIASSRLAGHHPVTYIADCMSRITAGHLHSKLDELMPWNWVPPNVGDDLDQISQVTREEVVRTQRVIDRRRLTNRVQGTKSSP